MDWRHISDLIDVGRKLYGAMLNLVVWNKSNAGKQIVELAAVIILERGAHSLQGKKALKPGRLRPALECLAEIPLAPGAPPGLSWRISP